MTSTVDLVKSLTEAFEEERDELRSQLDHSRTLCREKDQELGDLRTRLNTGKGPGSGMSMADVALVARTPWITAVEQSSTGEWRAKVDGRFGPWSKDPREAIAWAARQSGIELPDDLSHAGQLNDRLNAARDQIKQLKAQIAADNSHHVLAIIEELKVPCVFSRLEDRWHVGNELIGQTDGRTVSEAITTWRKRHLIDKTPRASEELPGAAVAPGVDRTAPGAPTLDESNAAMRTAVAERQASDNYKARDAREGV